MENWILFSLIAFLMLSVSRIGFKLAGSFNAYLLVLAAEAIAAVTALVLVIFLRPTIEWSAVPVIPLIVIGVSFAFTDIFFILALQNGGHVAVTNTIVNMNTILVALVSFAFLKENLSLLNWVGIVLGMAGLVLLVM